MWKHLGFDNTLAVTLREMRSHLKVSELKSVSVFNKVMLMPRLRARAEVGRQDGRLFKLSQQR